MKTETRERRDVEMPEGSAVDGQLVHRDTSTGANLPIPSHTHGPNDMPLSLRDQTFENVATNPVTSDEDKILRNKVNEIAEIDILPTGEVYMSHVFVRRRLNDAFSPMGWALRPLSAIAVDPNTNVMYREYALVVKGVVVATAFGSTKYQPANERMDYADAAEAVRSNALTRCAKDLGIGSECWDPRFCQQWISKYAVHVWTGYRDRQGDARVADYWRRVDVKPLRNEFALVVDTPNQKHKDLKPLNYNVAGSWAEAKDLFASWLQSKRRKEPPVEDPQRGEPVPADAGADRSRNQNLRPAKETKNPTKATPEDAEFLRGGITMPGKLDPWAAGLLIKDCRVLKRGVKNNEPWTLYLIVMMDGTEYTTFSATVFNRAQLCWASRTLVDIDYEEVDVYGRRRKQIQGKDNFQLYQMEAGSEG